MNMDFDAIKEMIAGRFKQLGGELTSLYGKFTGDDVLEAEGDTKALAGKLQANNPEMYATADDAMEAAENILSKFKDEDNK